MMNGDSGNSGTGGGRMQWGSYGFLAGILLGIVVGWMFAGFVGALFRIAIVLVAVVPLVLLYLAWRKYLAPVLRPPTERRPVAAMDAIETRAVVRSTFQDSQVL